MKWRYLLLLFFPLFSFCQDFSYSHYDSRDGLASTTVYCMTQDKDGFLWFGTETGVSRFDGTHFRNFTKEDGLPDNDVTQLYADSKGRVWMAPFKKSVCYYYRGTIHNSDNDPVLKKLHINDNVVHFAEDNAGNILFQETTVLHVLKTNGEVVTLVTDGTRPLGYITTIGTRKEGGFWVMQNGNVYILHNDRFLLWTKVTHPYDHLHFNYAALKYETLLWRKSIYDIGVRSFEHNRTYEYFLSQYGEYVNSAIFDQHSGAICTINGAYVYDLHDSGKLQHHLKGITVSNSFRDSEGNLWFTTMGKGAYRLNSSKVLTVEIEEKKLDAYWVNAIKTSKERMMAASVYNVIRNYSKENGKWEQQHDFAWHSQIPFYSMISLPDGHVAVGSKFFLEKVNPDLVHRTDCITSISVKFLCTDGNNILVSTDKDVIRIDVGSFKVTDTVWHERPTCIFLNNDTIYIGTLTGLYRLLPGNKPQYLGENIKPLQGRIAAVREDANHVIWVATAGDGLFGWRNGELVASISRHNGLLSNICRTLFYENGHLWVGTDKGLCKVNVLQPGYPIDKYTTSDGLSSDIINTVYVNNNKVFVGTSEGITFFEEDKIASQSQCVLRFVDISVGGTTWYPADAPLSIPHNKNSIQFNYVGISFKSGGDIRYRYRLLGLDSSWKETRETFLSYPTLPSGDYQLQLQAINKFDVSSQLLTASFTIEKLLYERTWFRVLIGLLFLAVTGLVVWLIIRRVRKREQEKTAISKRISELEQLSRKAQMNPHFIFNSLNSIQQYVMDSDVTGANKFISGFSRLIRQTLDFSSKPEISLEEELDYLSNYLELEKTRLENAFSWSVTVEPGLDKAEYYIPPMILQPFVENSVRHGLRFRRDKNGLVTITVKRETNHLVCIVEDNGVGRKAAMQYKSMSPISYQSKGLSLTADRITMFNKEHEQKITMQIDDLEDDEQVPLGTRVTISFPVL
ncbi:hypothetical protein A3860_35530 [Niastella vici]|uniref:Signal transduction histidine kinase internal region domain-containing protein n=1 Tax=Niastella vici TaxID=1703345 RepID=A0A1V9FNX2_9BACT|nr:two-component regulator propeller domain-containing protein [Niastella vici]OQP59956.1 hypothetical protein A3860_35530 [Niastella vici]